MNNMTEFTPGSETPTVTMTMPLSGGEHFGKPVSIGYYNTSDEVWIDGECGRLNIPLEHMAAFIKQLKRAAAICNAGGNESP